MIAFRQIENRFSLELSHDNPLMNALFRALRPGVERSLALHQLSAIAEASDRLDTAVSPENRILQTLGASCAVDEEELERIPAEGPLVVVANHPFGGVEGLLLASILKRRRPDVRIMANFILGQIHQLRELFILVDPFGTDHSARANLAAMKQTLQWLDGGGVLGVFPAGEVSHFDLRRGRVSDPPWSKSIGRLVQRSGAAVLPVYFEGQNGPLFQTLGLVHPLLRTARLPYEFVNKRGFQTRAHVGPVIPPARLARFKTPGDVTAYLRIRTELQRPEAGAHSTKAAHPATAAAIATRPALQPVIPQSDMRAVRDEIAALPADALLVTHDHFRVFIAPAAAIPTALREIGRLREITFRANNEGTGTEIDLDRFDAQYLHLFLWDERAGEIAAAYRLGRSDHILATAGKNGLYTRTLFNIRKRLLRQISPALEMGRSFVRQEHQRQFLPLMLLWRGIGTYISRNPQYKHLFGPVSINSAYSSTSQQLLIEFLRRSSMDARARLVRPKTPPPAERIRDFDPRSMSTVVRDLADLSSLIADIEEDHRDIPILLKQYLKLGGMLLGFNIDPDFSNVLDGLILVDLTRTEPRILERYMGKEGVRTFLEYHGLEIAD